MFTKKNKIILRINILLGCILLVLLTGFMDITLAFFTSSDKLDNKLRTVGSEVYLLELFHPDDLWLPGETKDKVVSFGNWQKTDQVIRFKVKTEWIDEDGFPWAYTGNYTPDPIVINWTEEISGGTKATWIKIGDYYYYKKVLLQREGVHPTELPPVMESVTFSDELSNDNSHSEDFSNKTCRLYVEMETLNVNPDITAEAWNVTFTQEGTFLKWVTA